MSGPTRLIVHADDFGYAEAINRGIVAAFDAGIVTSTSIMATGAAFEHAIALARARPRLDVGVHLVLTEHRPLGAQGGANGLGGSAAGFAPSVAVFAGRLLAGRVSLAAVRAELDAQIRRARDAGLTVSHLDGHQHVHALPGVARVVVELAEAHGIRAVRVPRERLRVYAVRGGAGVGRLLAQAMLGAVAAVSPLARLRRCDEFVGFAFGGRLDERRLAALIGALPAGRSVELMCHPGDEDMTATPQWRYAWAAERAALTSPRVRELLAARGIALVSYRDL